MIYLMNGVLPWLTKKQILHHSSINLRRQIADDESDIQRLIILRDPTTLCERVDGNLNLTSMTVIDEIQQFLTYCQELPRSKRPDYKLLRNYLMDIRIRENGNENLEWY